MKEDIKPKSISTTKALGILAKNIPDIVFTAISSLVVVHPEFAIMFLTGKGIFNAWGEFGQEKLNELTIGLEKSKGTFDPAIIETEEFKSVFLSVLERHMKESSDVKRQLLRNYLISVGQGKNPSFDYHTKLLNILDQITGDELRLFMLLPNIVEDSDKEMAHLSAQSQTVYDLSKREISMNTLQVKMRLKNWEIKTKNLSALIRFLTNYGLISSQDTSTSGIGGAGSTDINFEGVTDMGEIFYKFIDDSMFNKDIICYTEYQKNPSFNREALQQ